MDNKFFSILKHLDADFGSGVYLKIENLFSPSYQYSQAFRNVVKDLDSNALIEIDGGRFVRERRPIMTDFSNLGNAIHHIRNAPGKYYPLYAKITLKGHEYLGSQQSCLLYTSPSPRDRG